jgi:hypothetical protein
MDPNSASAPQSNLQLLMSNLQSLNLVIDRVTNEYNLKNKILREGLDEYQKLTSTFK